MTNKKNQHIISKAAELKTSSNLVVLKGYVDNNVSIEDILNNKFQYFSKYMSESRPYMLYSEFIALYSFVMDQYSKITILDNNTYLNFYPIDIKIGEQKLDKICDYYNEDTYETQVEDGHFEDNTNESENNEDINELVNLYANVIKVEGDTYVVYNEPVKDEKIDFVNLWGMNQEDAIDFVQKENNEHSLIDIIDEIDYLKLVKAVLNSEEEGHYINIDSPFLENQMLIDKLSILKRLAKPGVRVMLEHSSQPSGMDEYDSKYRDLLKKYWGFDKFLDIKIYDNNLLEEGKKKIKEVSQEQIIDTVVQESLKANCNNSSRDIFITAPTGSGKSAIFQIPALYLAEEKNLMTIIISPLIALMKDQVKSLESKGCHFAKTINSDISPVKKRDILEQVAESKCHILYISPETLLSRSDIEQLIGEREIGLFVIDEAHIVTTWGKQFRPDYWFLGDHVRKIRKRQIERHGCSFPIATFTATAIYGGMENMYKETRESLHMIQPITFLGEVRRDDIDLNIKPTQTETRRTEYELIKFDQLLEIIKRSIVTEKKTLIYFPTVALIRRFYDYCFLKNVGKYVSYYHGQLDPITKEENFEKFYNKETFVMLATKAFGMGIDIEDIELVAHFAPTGNVCDYVQEIGRAARSKSLKGEAYYRFMNTDFKHINRLHGLSMVKEYQLVDIICKVHDLYVSYIKRNGGAKKRNQMLIDAESFSHIFETPFYDNDDAISKVKTGMLMIQKDYERQFGYSPFYVRPIPLFSYGFFQIPKKIQREYNKMYKASVKEVDAEKGICQVNLQIIWEKGFNEKFSFPQFKYLLYTKSEELKLIDKESLIPALMIEVFFEGNFIQDHTNIMEALQNILEQLSVEGTFFSIEDLSVKIQAKLKINKYRARNIAEVLVTTISAYQRDHYKSISGKLITCRVLNNGTVKYRANNAIFGFFDNLRKCASNTLKMLKDDKLYLVDGAKTPPREYMLYLGFMETCGLLKFKSLGGNGSQIYIHINSTKAMKYVIEKPYRYRNKLLELVKDRHILSVIMLTYLYENNFSSDEIWDYIEDYFLGKVPGEVIKIYEEKTKKCFAESL